ncbi:MAG: DUF4437 domain-containing protein, partial [Candidatus Thiodiazotropha taylori]
MRPILLHLFISAVITLCFNTYVVAEPVKQVVLASEIDWQQLNPARGDKSPQAGTLWGDRR